MPKNLKLHSICDIINRFVTVLHILSPILLNIKKGDAY